MPRDLTLFSPTSGEMMEMARRPLEPGECALIVIDVQERLLAPIFEKERLVKNLQLLLRLAGILELPILATTQYANKLGETVPELRSLLPKKSTSRCFPASAARPSARLSSVCPGTGIRFCSLGSRATSA